MSNDTKSKPGAVAASDLEVLSQQLDALREDMSRLTHTVTGIAGGRGSDIAADIAEGIGEAKHYVESNGKSVENQLEETVAAHPLLALGLAAGAGLLIGAMSRR